MSILDASVVLKWFVDEENSDKAIQLREEYYAGEREIVIPDLLLFEVANALRYNPDFEPDEIKDSVKTLFDMGIEIIIPTYSLLEKAIDLAKSLDVTCYDAAYLALAGDLGFEFITADRKFYNKVRDEVKKVTPIKLLADLKEGTEEEEKTEEET